MNHGQQNQEGYNNQPQGFGQHSGNKFNQGQPAAGSTVPQSGGGSRTVSIAIIAFIIGFGLGWMAAPEDETDNTQAETNEETAQEESTDTQNNTDTSDEEAADNSNTNDTGTVSSDNVSLSVSDQEAGAVTFIDGAKFETASWIAIREDRDGEMGNILGAGWFPAGEHANIDVTLQRSLNPGEKHYAVIYADDGNKIFNFKKDTLLRDSEDRVITSTFTAN